MAVTIKLKNASGSDPSASDLVVGEVALRTDTAKLFTKKDDNSVAEIGVTTLGDNDVTTSTIADDAVTYAKIQNVSATNRILGRDSSGAGIIEEITPANLRTMLNVADGATNVTNTNQLTNGAGFITATLTNEQVQDIVGGMLTGNTETGITVTYQDGDGTIDFVVASQTDENFTTTLKNKLDGIAAGATNVTNTNQLTNGAGFITATLTNEQVQDIVGGMVSGNTESGITVTYQDGDGTLDFSVASQTDNNFTDADHNKLDGIEAGATADQSASEILTLLKTVDGAGSGLDADTVDGFAPTSFLRSDANDTTSHHITFEDNAKAKFGTDGDLQLYFNGTNSFIENTTGYLRITGTSGQVYIQSNDDVRITGHTADENMAIFHKNGAVELYHDNTKMFETTSSGVKLIKNCQAGVSTLTDGSTITVDFSVAPHFTVTLGGNRTFGDPSNLSLSVGSSGSIFIVQDGTGSRTASFHSDYKFVGGTAPTLSTAANAVDRIDYVIKDSSTVHCAVSLDVK